jgi:hypothetical protein
MDGTSSWIVEHGFCCHGRCPSHWGSIYVSHSAAGMLQNSMGNRPTKWLLQVELLAVTFGTRNIVTTVQLKTLQFVELEARAFHAVLQAEYGHRSNSDSHHSNDNSIERLDSSRSIAQSISTVLWTAGHLDRPTSR